MKNVDRPLYEQKIPSKKKLQIQQNAQLVDAIIGSYSMVLHTSENGDEITDVETASMMTGIYEIVAPIRQLAVLQVIRYWVEVLDSLEYCAMTKGKDDIPHFLEIFAIFYNDDSYFRTRKNWNRQ